MKYKKTIATSLIAAVCALAQPAIQLYEDTKTESYEDVVGVWTICSGVTKGIKPGMKMTKEQCADLDKATLAGFVGEVAKRISVPVSEDTLLAHVTFAYNIGIGGYNSSKTLRETNKGNGVAGCTAMLNWYTAGGKDCRILTNNCRGLITRRQSEVNLCLEGLK